METIDKEVLVGMLSEGMTLDEASNHLQLMYPGVAGFSRRSLQRFLSDNNIQIRKIVPQEKVDVMVSDVLSRAGNQLGRRYVKGLIESEGGPAISQKRVAESLKRVDPVNSSRRYQGTARQVNPIPYSADYFGHRLHLDQNEKLVRYGVTLVAAIDGFSGYVPAAAVMSLKNNVVIYEKVLRKAWLEFGLWDQIVVDHGREFYLCLAVHRSLQAYRTNTTREPYKQLPSMKNNRIERFWVEVNSRILYPLKRALITMEENGEIDLSNMVHKFCCSEVAQRVATVGLRLLVQARNNHTIPGKGRPVDLMSANDRTQKLDPGMIPEASAAAAEHRSSGGSLTEPGTFGSDPLSGNDPLIAERWARLAELGYSVDTVYGSVVNSDFQRFQQFLLEFVRETERLSFNAPV